MYSHLPLYLASSYVFEKIYNNEKAVFEDCSAALIYKAHLLRNSQKMANMEIAVAFVSKHGIISRGPAQPVPLCWCAQIYRVSP